MIMVKEWTDLSLGWKTNQECLFLPLLFSIVLEELVNVIKQQQKINVSHMV